MRRAHFHQELSHRIGRDSEGSVHNRTSDRLFVSPSRDAMVGTRSKCDTRALVTMGCDHNSGLLYTRGTCRRGHKLSENKAAKEGVHHRTWPHKTDILTLMVSSYMLNCFSTMPPWDPPGEVRARSGEYSIRCMSCRVKGKAVNMTTRWKHSPISP